MSGLEYGSDFSLGDSVVGSHLCSDTGDGGMVSEEYYPTSSVPLDVGAVSEDREMGEDGFSSD